MLVFQVHIAFLDIDISFQADGFQESIDTCANGTITPNIERTFKLEEAGEAHGYMEANKARSLLFRYIFPNLFLQPYSYEAEIME